jgi:cyclopropane fatty-acyl-phospholipid synthase-like methyltransferase
MTERPHPPWDDSYTGGTPAPWDIGRPQPAFARLADEGRLTGRLLDAGCGTGENALLAASRGADVTGIDLAPTAIARAREKASARGLAARFEVADALDLGRLGLTVDTVIDSGVFHVFGDGDRARYVASLAAVLRPGGACYLMCFSDRQPGTFGPRRVRADELRAAFSDGWTVESVTADTFDINPVNVTTQARAWLAVIRRS